MHLLKYVSAVAVTIAAFASGARGFPTSGAKAATPDCSLYSHCYSILQGNGTTFYGMEGTWARVNMTTPQSRSNPQFLDSEMWFLNGACGGAWAEEGLFDGYEKDIGKGAYEVFFAWMTTGGTYNYTPIAYISPNSSVTDNYQISAPSSNGAWNVWWDGNNYRTPATGFTSGSCPQMGAEVASSGACARTFNMYSMAFNSGGQAVYWGSQGGRFSPPGIGGVDLNGVSYQNSEWSWSTVQDGC